MTTIYAICNITISPYIVSILTQYLDEYYGFFHVLINFVFYFVSFQFRFDWSGQSHTKNVKFVATAIEIRSIGIFFFLCWIRKAPIFFALYVNWERIHNGEKEIINIFHCVCVCVRGCCDSALRPEPKSKKYSYTLTHIQVIASWRKTIRKWNYAWVISTDWDGKLDQDHSAISIWAPQLILAKR